MKHIVYVLLAAALIAGNPTVKAEIIAFENFDGKMTGFEGTGWSGFSSATGSMLDDSGQYVECTASGKPSRSLTNPINLTSYGVYYVAALFKATGTNQYSGVKLDNGDGKGPQILWRNSGGYRLYKENWLSNDDIAPFAADTVYLAVMKLDSNPAGDSMSVVMYNLTGGDQTSSTEPDNWDASYNVSFSRTIDRITLEGTSSIKSAFDNIMVATEWSDITAIYTPRGSAHTFTPTGLFNKDDAAYIPNQLTWISGDEPDDPNLLSVNFDMVYYSIPAGDVTAEDPNFDHPAVEVFTDVSSPYELTFEYDTAYFYRIDSNVIWDTNDLAVETIRGKAHAFTTKPAYFPPAAEVENILTDMSLLPAGLSAVISENTDPIHSVSFEVLNDDLEFPTGASASVIPPTAADPDNPTTGFSTDMPGTYKVKVVIDDLTTQIEKFIEIEVYDDACQAKKEAGGWSANYYDRDDNCVVDLEDFAYFAIEWLDYTGLTEQISSAGNVYYISPDLFNSRIEAESVDPQAVSDAPLTDDTGIRVIDAPGATGGQKALGWTTPNPTTWAEYEINIPEAGTYDLYFSTAGGYDSATLLFGDGTTADKYGSAGPFLGSDNFNEYHISVLEDALTFDTAGSQTVRITWQNNQINLDWFLMVMSGN